MGSEASVDILKSELYNHFKPEDNHDSGGDKNNYLCIKNKYFTAHVKLLPFMSHNDSDDDLPLPLDQKEDGVLLVFSSRSMMQLDALTELHDSLPNAGDTLRLCISTSVGSTIGSGSGMTEKEYEDQYAQRVLWCLDRGYEYVEVDLSEDGLTTGFDVREKDGFARVVEAMGGTVWSSAKMTESKVKARNNIIQVTKDVEKKVDVDGAEDNECTSEMSANDNVVDISKEVSHGAIEPLPQEPNTGEDKDEEKKDEVAIIDEIENVMKEAKRIRESAINNDMSDDERRQRAGDAANMLMGLLDQMGFDEDEGEDDSSDEE